MFATFLDTHLATLTMNQATRCSKCGILRGGGGTASINSKAASSSISAFLARIRTLKSQAVVDDQGSATDRLSRKFQHHSKTHTPMLDRVRKSFQYIGCKSPTLL